MHGWPEQSKLKGEIKKYASEASHLTMQEGILLHDDRLVIPTSLQQEILVKRNKKHLIPLKMLEQTDDLTDFDIPETTKETLGTTRSGRHARPPNRLIKHMCHTHNDILCVLV